MSDSSGGGKGMAPELSAVELHERISMRAYEIYLERGGEGGDPLSDWLSAETAVLAEVSAVAPAAEVDADAPVGAAAAESKPAARRRASAAKPKAAAKEASPKSAEVTPAKPVRRPRSAPKPAE